MFKHFHISLISPEPANFPVVTAYKHLHDLFRWISFYFRLLTCRQGVNTVITDLCSCASFLSTSASFSSPHQLSCFRDELLFFLYLYQRRYDASHIIIIIPPPTQRARINTARCVHIYLNSRIQMQVFRNNEAWLHLCCELFLSKKHYAFFSTLKWQVYHSLTCNRENGNPGIDTAQTADMLQDYISLVACPALSHKNIFVQSGLALMT